VKIIVKKKSNLTKGLIAAVFLITIITLFTTANAYTSNRVLFIAKGDDLDFDRTTNFIIGGLFSEGDELPSAKAFFHQRIYDESGELAYAMSGMLTDGIRLMTNYYFYCPVFNVWFINVWMVMGEGIVKTTDTNYNILFRNSMMITMPNTEGDYVEAQMFMLLSPTAEYCLEDPGTYPPGEYPEVFILPGGAWVLATVLWDVGIPMDAGFGFGILPVGPISYLTTSWGI
jgi:hypothetical protein